MARPRRRPRGDGTFFQRGDYYVKELSLGRGPDGKRKRITVYARTIAELNQKLAEAKKKAENDSPTEQDTPATVGGLLDRWYAAVAPAVSEGTGLMYDQHIRLHIKPHVGGVRTQDLNKKNQGVAVIERLIARLGEGDGAASPVMIRKVFTTLRAALEYAVTKTWLDRNPTDTVRKQLPQQERGTKGTLNPDEARALIAAADGERLSALIDVAIDSGCRMGELFALTWRDYDTKAGVLSVTKAVIEVRGHQRLKEKPKTKKGVRSVVLSFALPALEAHRERMQAEGQDVRVGVIFCDSRGGYLRKSNLITRFFDPLAKRAGLDHITFHWLRHSSASLMLAAGADLATVSRRLGHASAAFTLSTYTHAVHGIQAAAADQLRSILDPPPKGSTGT